MERDGIRLRIELVRNPMPGGEVTLVHTMVRNLADEPLLWGSDGCGTSVYVQALDTAAAWPPGTEQEDEAHVFKRRALGWNYQYDTRAPDLRFTRPEFVGRSGYACADVGLGHRIAPGEAVEATRAWDGLADERLGPYPAGPVTLVGSFGQYRRPGERYDADALLTVELPSWVRGGVPDPLSPPEIVDVALADPAFAAFLVTRVEQIDDVEVAIYRPELEAWEVGIARRLGGGRGWEAHLLLIDPTTGEILDTVDRPWTWAKDSR